MSAISHLRRLLTVLLLACAFVSVFSGLNPSPVHAHIATIGYSEINIQRDTMKVSLYLDPIEVDQWLDTKIRKTFVLDPKQPQKQAGSAMGNVDAGELDMFVTSNLVLKNNGSPSMLSIEGSKLEKRGENHFVRIDLSAVFDRPVENYEIQYNFFFDDIDPKHQNFLHIKSDGAEINQVLNSGSRVVKGSAEGAFSQPADGAMQISIPAWLSTVWKFIVMGAEHIWTGYDHLLFLLGLVILKQKKWDYIKILTAFTFGHSITLASSALNFFSVSFKIIEPLIAFSIVYIAVENIWLKRTQWRWGVAALFGLIHGFGFSDILRGTLGDQVLLSLFSFNLGVEIGQLAVLGLLLPLLWLLGRAKWYPRVVYSVSGIIGFLGLFWFVERMLGIGQG